MKIAEDLRPLLRPIEDLTLLPDNPRRGAVAEIAKSLQRFGQRKPIVIDDQGIIVAGNHTYQAALSLGWTEIAVTDSGDLTPEEIRAYSLADNGLSDLATYDNEALFAQLDGESEIPGFNSDRIEDLTENLWPAHAFDDTEEGYSRKVESPIYEPTGPPAPVTELTDRTRTNELLDEIEETDLPDDVYAFLVAAAERHTVFQYGLIANYYANAPVEIQRLMEASALVIIDFDQALARGFVRLNEDTDENFHADHPDA